MNLTYIYIYIYTHVCILQFEGSPSHVTSDLRNLCELDGH